MNLADLGQPYQGSLYLPRAWIGKGRVSESTREALVRPAALAAGQDKALILAKKVPLAIRGRVSERSEVQQAGPTRCATLGQTTSQVDRLEQMTA